MSESWEMMIDRVMAFFYPRFNLKYDGSTVPNLEPANVSRSLYELYVEATHRTSRKEARPICNLLDLMASGQPILLPAFRDAESALNDAFKPLADIVDAADKTQDIEQHMTRVAQAVGDDNTTQILAIANRGGWSGERRMKEILRVDRRFEGKDSIEWSALLGVSPAAIRGYQTWKVLQQQKKADD
jgi:hypothetical protein